MTDSFTMKLGEFRNHLRANGFEPNEKSLREMYAALPHLDALRARLRREYTRADEPAHVFSVRVEKQ